MGRIIVIDGTSNAGKTTLCENIERNIRNIAIIPGASLFAKIHHEKYPEIPGIPRNAKEEKENQKFFFKLELDRLIEANKLALTAQAKVMPTISPTKPPTFVLALDFKALSCAKRLSFLGSSYSCCATVYTFVVDFMWFFTSSMQLCADLLSLKNARMLGIICTSFLSLYYIPQKMENNLKLLINED